MQITRKVQLIDALQVIANITRCIAIKRALTNADPEPDLNFWRVQVGNLLDIAVLDWCKLFGSDDPKHQQLHWKNVFSDHTSFKAGLFGRLGLRQNTWDAYWNEMKVYRDQHVAHLDFIRRDITNYPKLDYALSSAMYYYKLVITELRALGETGFPDDLGIYYEKFLTQTSVIAKSAMLGTAGFEEAI